MNNKNYDYLKASSAQDCTGLIPAKAKYEEELENYESLYPFLPHAVVTDTDSKNTKYI